MLNNSKDINHHIHCFIEKSLPFDVTKIPIADNNKPLAAVLMLLHEVNSNWEILFIVKAQHLHKHAGEVAFPGGKYEPQDNNLWLTALRETEEEIGVHRKSISFVSTQPARISLHRSIVHPFIGWIEPNTQLRCNSHEIENIFSVPLQFFVNNNPILKEPKNEYQFIVPCWQYQDHIIWGLTAKILSDFLHINLGFNIEYFPDQNFS